MGSLPSSAAQWADQRTQTSTLKQRCGSWAYHAALNVGALVEEGARAFPTFCDYAFVDLRKSSGLKESGHK
jgi:hypothetical protein